ncbi:hypothetical protein BJV82DRAFT_202435 [Fennellomyces sp. T-0311]|nr:hypothetical protein BJV82DRAFT_202435 [Fennellomyces sp. T-0311]
MSQSLQGSDIAEMMHRLRTRLALANFKRQYGYEKYDLHTLELSLFQPAATPRRKKTKKKEEPLPNYYRRYYPNESPSVSPPIRATRSTPLYNIRSPLSAKRSTSPRYRFQQVKKSSSTSTSSARKEDPGLLFSSDEEDAANLLVMLHNHATTTTQPSA